MLYDIVLHLHEMSIFVLCSALLVFSLGCTGLVLEMYLLALTAHEGCYFYLCFFLGTYLCCVSDSLKDKDE